MQPSARTQRALSASLDVAIIVLAIMQSQLHSASFFAAVQRADTNELMNLLHSVRLAPEQGKDQRGYTALHVAALNNSVEVVECLFTYVRNNYEDPAQTLRLWVGVTTEEGFTCLHFAAFRGSLVSTT